MPTMDTRPFRPQNNIDILNAIRKLSSTDYQRRIPAATKANVQSVIQGLLDWSPSMNEFINGLVNQIGMQIYRTNSWTNPLAKFKRGMLTFGDTIEEIQVGLLKANIYDPDREYLEKDIFGQEIPDVQVSFHKINRQNYYKLTVNESLLRRAFTEDMGLSGFITQLMEAPQTSDEWDEFNLMASIFPEYYRAGGFFKVNVPAVSATGSTAEDSKTLLRAVREMSQTLPFISTFYNPAGMPVAANPDELELFTTPAAMAAMDVEALAGAFNIEKADIPSRTTILPKEQFAIPGIEAILTTRDYFVVADSKIETTQVLNPIGLHTNYFLHHWQTISVSRFAPAILFTSAEASTVIPETITVVTGVTTPTIQDANGNTVTTVARGGLFNIVSSAITNPAAGPNDAVRFELIGAQSPRTYLTQSGMLHVALDEASELLTINVYAVDTDIPQLEATLTPTVTGDLAILWPDPNVLPDVDNDGLLEVTPKAPTFVLDNGSTTAGTITIPSVTGVQYMNGASNVNNGSQIHITTSTTITAVARTGYEIATGAVTSWTFA